MAQHIVNSAIPLPSRFGEGVSESDLAAHWPAWKRTFNRYALISNLGGKPNAEQVSLFLYSMGPIADKILATQAYDEDAATLRETTAIFDGYFKVRTNVITERAKFNRRTQQQGESVDSFIQDLYVLADNCGFAALREELIRDRIVVGVLDSALSDRLQAVSDLTLAQAAERARQAETRSRDKAILRESVGHSVSQVANHSASRPSVSRKHNKHVDKAKGKSCFFCGKTPSHSRDECPARKAECRKCGKTGHFQSVCKSSAKAVNQVDTAGTPQSYFLGEVQDADPQAWIETVTVNGRPTSFKLDTGASVSIMRSTESWLSTVALESSPGKLFGPGGNPLPTKGSFLATFQYQRHKHQERVYIVQNQDSNLLSRNACVHLQLVKRLVGEVTSSKAAAEFPNLFEGLGKLSHSYTIQLCPDAKPFCLYAPRRVPHPLLPKVKEELDAMQQSGVISPVKEPTEWCSGLVVVPKPSGKVRLCVDLTRLNTAVRREVHPMTSVDESLAKLGGSTIFSKLDANSGFYQIPLDPESALLTTFVTPFGRFRFNRLPFGISSAPEIFQRTMSEILEGLPGVICHMDDILVHAAQQEEHDERLRAVLTRLCTAGLTLSVEKCAFSQKSITFLGHVISDEGIQADPRKTTAITKFPAPTNVTELQRFFGMVNQLAKFVPSLTDTNAPLRQLLKSDTQWTWGPEQQLAFDGIKAKISSPEVLAHYVPTRETIIAADASRSGLGAVLLQVQPTGDRRPVCYASRTLTSAEKNYAVNELEALAITWASEKFSDYVLGLNYTVETDHKPLVPLLSTTELCKMPPRIQRFRLRLMRFTPTIRHVPGKQQIVADALSRAPTEEPNTEEILHVEQVEEHATLHFEFLPASTARIQEITDAQKHDGITAQVREYCRVGWPAYASNAPAALKPYWEHRPRLTLVNDVLLFDDRLVIPAVLQPQILDRIHDGHLGISKCRELARSSVWWPGLSTHIEQLVKNCRVCTKVRPEPTEPLQPSSYPDEPWERVGTDIFDWKGSHYILAVDYYSRWTEIRPLSSLTSQEAINCLKSIFATHGIPEVLVSDNGPQFASTLFNQFAENYGFCHVTSSPRYPQSNGMSERAVRTIKNMLKTNDDPYLGLLAYRAAPLHSGKAPCELLMGRHLRTRLVTAHPSRAPVSDDDVREKEEVYRAKAKANFDRRHRAVHLQPLPDDSEVWIRDLDRPGTVVAESASPRSYLVATDKGTVRRNRRALVPDPTTQQADDPATESAPTPVHRQVHPNSVVTPTADGSKPLTTRSGREVKPVKKLDL